VNQSTSFSCISCHSPPRLAHVVAFDALSVAVAFVAAAAAFVVVGVEFGDLCRSIGLLKLTKMEFSQILGAAGFGLGAFAW
jgi:hypothetical protein